MIHSIQAQLKQQPKLLGQGTTSKIYLICLEGQFYALKLFATEYLHVLEQELISKEIQSQYTVKYYMHHENWILYEQFGHGNLLELILERQLSFKEVSYISMQLIAAVKELHAQNLYHNDLKLENILVNDQMQIKLCDFGMMDRKRSYNQGTVIYLAPEEYDNYRSQLFALGVVQFAMCFGYMPFDSFKCALKSHVVQKEWSKFWMKATAQSLVFVPLMIRKQIQDLFSN